VGENRAKIRKIFERYIYLKNTFFSSPPFFPGYGRCDMLDKWRRIPFLPLPPPPPAPPAMRRLKGKSRDLTIVELFSLPPLSLTEWVLRIGL